MSTEEVLSEWQAAMNDTAYFYVSGDEISDITLSECHHPESLISDARYRMPTKWEVMTVLRYVAPPSGYWKSRQRVLCYDNETGVWYSFAWNIGNVTKAGYKTPYTVMPIRTERRERNECNISISINDKWQ